MSRPKLFTRLTYLLLILTFMCSVASVAIPGEKKVNAAPSVVWVDNDAPAGWYADPTHFNKIQSGITAVSIPGTVYVSSGTYQENITMKDKVQVLGAGAAVTIIDGGKADSVVKASNVEATTKLDSFTITNGEAYLGGGINLSHSSLSINDCIFSNNSASGSGGGIYNSHSSPTITDCIFEGNTAGFPSSVGYGGGMYNRESSFPIVTNCIFSNNSARHYGGAIQNSMSSPTLRDCIFNGNSAGDSGITAYGGGVHNIWSSPTILNCIFINNSATQHGGGLCNVDHSSPTVTNCVFWGNSATYYGGGIFSDCYTSLPTITNCILANNTVSYSSGGGGLHSWNGSPLADYNNLWSNSPNNYGGDAIAGIHDISQDPMFTDPLVQDFHLISGSPCIDAGTNAGTPTEDKDGEPRPIDGNWDGTATTDMGAYEYMPVLPVDFYATQTIGPTPLEIQFINQTPADFSSWSWDFGDGDTSNQQNPTHIYNRPGPFTVNLTINSISGRGTETKVDYIHPYTQGVGGKAYPLNKLAILAPWIASSIAFIASSFIVFRRYSSQD